MKLKFKLFSILIFVGVLAAGIFVFYQSFDGASAITVADLNSCYSCSEIPPATLWSRYDHIYSLRSIASGAYVCGNEGPVIIDLSVGQTWDINCYRSYYLQGTGDPSQGSGYCEESAWESDNSSVAKIDTNGIIIAESVGSTTVSLFLQGAASPLIVAPVCVTKNKTLSALVNVVNPSSPHTLVISPASIGLSINETKQPQALYDPDGPSGSEAQRNIGSLALWSSDNPAIAAVDGFGKITVLSAGATTIRAKYAGLEAVASVTVQHALSPQSATLVVGNSQDFQFYLSGSAVTSCDAQWASASPSIATVSVNQTSHQNCTGGDWGIPPVCTTYYTCDSAKVTGIKAGSTTISVSYQGFTATAPIEVKNPNPVLRIVPLSVEVGINGTSTFTAFYDPDGTESWAPKPEAQVTDCAVSWSSSDILIATVSVNQTSHQNCSGGDAWSPPVCTTYYTCDSAKVTGKAQGSAYISVSYQGSPPAQATVAVKGSSLRISPDISNVVLGYNSPNVVAYFDPDGPTAPQAEQVVTDCSISWSSDDDSIAIVAVNKTSHQNCTGGDWGIPPVCTTYYTCDSAKVTGKAQGSTKIRATYQGIPAEATVVVRDSFPPALRIYSPGGTSFILGLAAPYGIKNFDARYDPDGVDSRPEEVLGSCDTNTLSWSSSDNSIATIEVNKTSRQSCTGEDAWGQSTCTTYYVCDSVKVTAKGVGTAKIKVVYQGMPVEEIITVRNPNPPVFRINPASFSLLTGGRATTELIAYFDQDGTDPSPEQVVTDCSISWSSDDDSIAIVAVNKTSHQNCTGGDWGIPPVCTTYYTCDSATASGRNSGATKIRVTYQGKPAEAPVVVRECCWVDPQCDSADLKWISFYKDDLGWGSNPTVTSFAVDEYLIYLGEDPELKINSRVQSVPPGQETFYPGIPVGYQSYHWTGLKSTPTTYYWKVKIRFHGTYQFSGQSPVNFSGTSETPGKPFTTVCSKTLRIEPTQATIVVGQTQQFKAFYDPDGQGPQTEQEVTNQSVWSTQESLIATINNVGLATGQSEGQTPIRATYQGLTADANLTVNAAPVLSASLIANPNEGVAPLNDVDLIASVQGTAVGTLNYTFWCNCDNSGTAINAVKAACGNWDYKIDGVEETDDNPNDNPYTALDICDYPSSGTYTPKVIVERGLAASAEARTNITVTPPGSPPEPPGPPGPPPGPNNPPQSSDLKMSPAFCGPSCHDCLDPLHPVLSWTFSDPNAGDTQSKYRVEFDTNKNFVSPDSEKVIIERESSSPTVTVMNGSLKYDETYYWRMKVWDSRNPSLASSWTYYGQDTDPINYKTYATPKHEYPVPDFDKSPQTPKKGEEVQFTDQSQAFGSSTISQWKWQFTDATPNESSDQNPSVVFNSIGQKKPVKLTVWDSDGLWCDIQKDIRVSGILPKWREIIPW